MQFSTRDFAVPGSWQALPVLHNPSFQFATDSGEFENSTDSYALIFGAGVF